MLILFLLQLAAARLCAVVAHELSHAATARALGWRSFIRLHIVGSIFGTAPSKTIVPGLSTNTLDAFIIRHAGWAFSVVLALVVIATGLAPLAVSLALFWTALDAVTSDLAGCCDDADHQHGQPGACEGASVRHRGLVCFCGNFGLILLKKMHKADQIELLRAMIKVTMQRGAQSAGLVTYRSRPQGRVGSRVRVVNGKRTDLAKLLLDQCAWKGMFASSFQGPTVFQGHTRFATSSIANFDGCHPHQWQACEMRQFWSFTIGKGLTSKLISCESFITHNGDLDGFKLNGITYSLGDLQQLLPAILHQPMTAKVDSMCVAGLLDLLRTKGLWMPSLRYGFVAGALKKADGGLMSVLKSGSFPSATAMYHLATAIEGLSAKLAQRDDIKNAKSEGLAMRIFAAAIRAPMLGIVREKLPMLGVHSALGVAPGPATDVSVSFVDAALAAFTGHSLLAAAQLLIGGSVGSFGLVLSHSLDIDTQLVIAARGQPMSFAVYPKLGAIVFGSEAQATKVGLDFEQMLPDPTEGAEDPVRVDLDDLTGETVLISWGKAVTDTTSKLRRGSIGAVINPGKPGAEPRNASSLGGSTTDSGSSNESTTPRDIKDIKGSIHIPWDAPKAEVTPALADSAAWVTLGRIGGHRSNSITGARGRSNSITEHAPKCVNASLNASLEHLALEATKQKRPSITLSSVLDVTKAKRPSMALASARGGGPSQTDTHGRKNSFCERADSRQRKNSTSAGAGRRKNSFSEVLFSLDIDSDTSKQGIELLRYPVVVQDTPSIGSRLSALVGLGRQHVSSAVQPSDATCRVRGGKTFGLECVQLFSFYEGDFLQPAQLRTRSIRLVPGKKSIRASLDQADPVGTDLEDIPSELLRIQREFDVPESSKHGARWSNNSEHTSEMSVGNLFVTHEFVRLLRDRMRRYAQGTHDGSLDVLITGCEVSLWVGEQFAADLNLVFPHLSVSSVSANKLLGHLGQEFEIPTVGFQFKKKLHGTIVLLISHTGGTFATIGTANLLRDVTPNLFVMTENWDTQLARAILKANAFGASKAKERTSNFVSSTFKRARIFTTNTGPRPAEPCSISVAATHQLLTQLLLHLMLETCNTKFLGGSDYSIHIVQDLARLNADSIKSLEEIIDPGSAIHRNLWLQGTRWAWHVLEGPVSWIMSALYILVTVLLGTTPLLELATFFAGPAQAALDGFNLTDAQGYQDALANAHLDPAVAGLLANDSTANVAVLQWAANLQASTERPMWAYVIAVLDAIIYMFLPWWTTVLLRLVQGRPWLHRVAGRSLVIGDVPWVAQSLEAYVSKLFALSYSIASINVLSGNPVDHLVHRHTHRVTRGVLVAVGRPDGRLNSLTSAEASIMLSTSQASSIQNMGVTCESITLGHNPATMSLTQNDIVLPTNRPLFLSEARLIIKLGVGADKGACGSLMGAMSDARMSSEKMSKDALDEMMAKQADSVRVEQEQSFAQKTRRRSFCTEAPVIGDESFGQGGQKPRRKSCTGHGDSQSFTNGHTRRASSSGAQIIDGVPATGSTDDAAPGQGDGAYVDPLTAAVDSALRSDAPPAARKGSFRNRKLSVCEQTQLQGEARLSEGQPEAAKPKLRRASTEGLHNFVSSFSPNGRRRSMEGAGESPEGSREGSCHGGDSLRMSLDDMLHADESSPEDGRRKPRRASFVEGDERKSEAKQRRNSVTRKFSCSGGPSPLGRRNSFIGFRPPARNFGMGTEEIERLKSDNVVGAWLLNLDNGGLTDAEVMQRLHLLQTLYESRIASLQRFVGFMVLFHRMAKMVQDFWPMVSFGLLGYSMSRTQSIMRVASTAAPVSGSDVRHKMMELGNQQVRAWAAHQLQSSLRLYCKLRKMAQVAAGRDRSSFPDGPTGSGPRRSSAGAPDFSPDPKGAPKAPKPTLAETAPPPPARLPAPPPLPPPATAPPAKPVSLAERRAAQKAEREARLSATEREQREAQRQKELASVGGSTGGEEEITDGAPTPHQPGRRDRVSKEKLERLSRSSPPPPGLTGSGAATPVRDGLSLDDRLKQASQPAVSATTATPDLESGLSLDDLLAKPGPPCCICGLAHDGGKVMTCKECGNWAHKQCLKAQGMPIVTGREAEWICPHCTAVQA